MFFQETYKQAAKNAVGQKIRVRGREVEILNAQGFSRDQNDLPLYEPILTMKPGGVYCPQFRSGLLFLVACRDGSGSGGCVLIRKVKIGETVYDGPARVCEALGIKGHGAIGSLTASRGILHLD